MTVLVIAKVMAKATPTATAKVTASIGGGENTAITVMARAMAVMVAGSYVLQISLR